MSGRVSPKAQTGSVSQHGRLVVASFQNAPELARRSIERAVARINGEGPTESVIDPSLVERDRPPEAARHGGRGPPRGRADEMVHD
jgi:hypothetical protein